MVVHQHACDALRIARALLKHRKLICVDGGVLVHSRFDVPARKITAIGSGESPRAESSDGCSLPVAIVDISGSALYTGIFQRLTEWTSPSRLRYGITSPR